MRLNWILLALLALSAVLSAYLFSDPQRAQDYAQMQREVSFSPATQDVLLGLLVLAIGGYVAWSYFKRD
jgi:hypothetical protein